MEYFTFRPLIDVPLSIATLLLLLRYFHYWVDKGRKETQVDVKARLRRACIKTTILIASVMAICWLADICFWCIVAAMLAVGLVLTILSGQAGGSGALLIASAYLIREWAFGFPELILQPPKENPKPLEQQQPVNQPKESNE